VKLAQLITYTSIIIIEILYVFEICMFNYANCMVISIIQKFYPIPLVSRLKS